MGKMIKQKQKVKRKKYQQKSKNVNEAKEIRKEKIDSDAVIKLKEKFSEDQKPSAHLKEDDITKANEKTENKSEKKEAPTEKQGKVNEQKEITKQKVDSHANIKLIEQQKEKMGEEQKPSEQLKVDNSVKANDKTETEIGKKEVPMKRQGGVNEPKVIAKEKVYSEADNKIEHKEKVNEGQKPYEQLKVDNTAKANDKTETKIGKKEAPMEMQGEEIEPKEVKKDDSDVEIKLVVQQKENFNEDQKSSEQLKVENKAKENDKTETK